MDKFRVTIAVKDLAVEPGKQVDVSLTIRNLSNIVDQYQIEIIGLDTAWYRVSKKSLALMPADENPITLTIAPPRDPGSRAGLQQFTIKVTSREFKEEVVTVEATLTIGPFFSYALDLTPQQQSSRTSGRFTVALENKGNVQVTFNLAAEDPEQGCGYEFKTGAPSVPPGESLGVGLTVTPRKRRLIGASKAYPFTVTASPQGYRDQVNAINGQLLYRPLLPAWLPPVIIALGVALVALVFFLIGQPPLIEEFVPDRTEVARGGEVAVIWRVSRAQTVELVDSLEPSLNQSVLALEGTLTIVPSVRGKHELTLVARRGRRTARQGREITVRLPRPKIEYFRASQEVERTQQIALKWKVIDATSVKVDPNLGDVSAEGGRYVDPPATGQQVTYKLVATNPDNDPVEAVADVRIIDRAVISRFDAQPPEIERGQQAILSWEAPGADSITISGLGNVSAPSGSAPVAPIRTTTYTLTASNRLGSATRSLEVRVRVPPEPPKVVSFRAERTSLTKGQSTRLCWQVSGARSARIEPDVGEVDPRSGCRSVSPQQTTPYILTATGQDGQTAVTSQPATINVTEPPREPPVVDRFDAQPTSIARNQSAQLCWSVKNARSARIEPDVGEVDPRSGCRSVSPSQTTSYVLTATGQDGQPVTSRPATVTVEVPQPARVERFDAQPASITRGQSTQLCWQVVNARSVRIEPDVGEVDPKGGCRNVSPQGTTRYILIVTGQDGQTIVHQPPVTVNVDVVVVTSPPTAGPTSPPTRGTVAVTGVTATVSPRSYSGVCPRPFSFTATITTDGAGRVTYRWERSDGVRGPLESLVFSGPGSQVVSAVWQPPSSMTGWQQVRIFSPNPMISNQATFFLTCSGGGPGVPGAPVHFSPPNGAVFSHYPRTTTLRWSPVPGAVSYVVEVEFCSPDGSTCRDLLTRTVAGTSFTFDFVGAQPGRWRVRAVFPGGARSPASEWWGFRYTR